MDDLSKAHIEYLKRQNNRSPHTIASRARVLRSVGHAAIATREDLQLWWECRAHLAPGTRAVDLAHLRAFYHWCQVWDHRADDPSIRLEAPRVPNGLARQATKADLLTLLEKLPEDLARAVRLGAYAGLRVSESAHLDWADVDDDADMLTIRESKGTKNRVVPVSPLLIAEIGPRVKGNVVTAGGDPYSDAALQRKLNRAIKATGVDVTTHQLRHYFGVIGYRATNDLLALGEMMGHASVNTTKIYAAAASDVKRKIAAAVMR